MAVRVRTVDSPRGDPTPDLQDDYPTGMRFEDRLHSERSPRGPTWQPSPAATVG